MSRKPKSSEIISNILNCSLLFPIITRWNSLFDSVSQLLKYRDKLNILTKELDLKFHFKEVDIDYLSEYVQLMKPIRPFTRRNKCLLWQFNTHFIFIEDPNTIT